MGRRVFTPIPTHDQLQALLLMEEEPDPVGLRARLVLLLCDGTGQHDVAVRCGVSRNMVSFWCSRFRRFGPRGLRDAPRSGRPRIPEKIVDQVCAAPWRKVKATAEELGIAYSTALRLRRERREVEARVVTHCEKCGAPLPPGGRHDGTAAAKS